MGEKTQGEKINEIWQGLFGVPESDDRDLVGDVKDLTKHVKKQNGRISKNTIAIVSLVSTLVAMGILDATVFNIVL